MRNINVGLRIYLSVITIFVAFAVAFIIFQQRREKEFKVESLNRKSNNNSENKNKNNSTKSR